MKKSAFLLAILMVFLMLAGCGDGKSTEAAKTSEPDKQDISSQDTTQASEAKTIEVTDMKGRKVTLTADVKRVVVTFNMEEYFAVSGEKGIDQLVGWSHKYWKGRRQDAYDAFTAVYPQLADIPDVGYNADISIESIISLQPDVVLASSTGANYDALEPGFKNLKDAGIECVFFDFHAQTIEKHTESIKLLGEILGQQARAEEIADYYTEQMSVISERLAGLSDDKRPRVYMEFSMGPGQFGNTWSEQMWGALIRECGGTNIVAGMTGASVEIAPEQVISANPEVIILACSPRDDVSDNVVLGYGADEALARKNLEAYKSREGWAELDAVKNNNLAALYHDLSRHIFDFAGAQFLAKQLQPEIFADLNPEKNLSEFFQKFMPVDLDGVWTLSLKEAQ
ncbi:MAG: ABC transporter substrate-binding protein [Bacillota bacterium]|nr:ABC transporter substrate-binding protein [Bacillota bacterium]